MARPTLRRLEVFVAVVDAGGIRAGSEILDISPAAVSHQVALLEEEIGYELFIRRRGRVNGLTAQGINAYSEAKELLGHAGAFQNALAPQPKPAVRRLSVYSDPILDEHLAKHIATFMATNSSVDIVLKRSYFEEMVDGLGKRTADIAWFYSAGPVNGLPSEFAWREPISICARRDHPLFSKLPLTLEDLRALPFVAPPPGSHFRRSVDAVFRRCGMDRYNIILEAGNANIAREAVINGFAISAVVTRYLDEELTRHGVVRVPILEDELALEVRCALRRDLALDRTALAVTQSLQRSHH
jgi:DNA-binding transcriptional LysR family regulator